MRREEVFCFVKATSALEAIDEVISSCAVLSALPGAFTQTVRQRERIQSTDIGHGVAIAHGKVPGLRHVRIALGFSGGGIMFRHGPGEPVKLLFVIASDPMEENQYVSSLSSVLRWVHDPSFRALMEKKDWEAERTRKFFSLLEAQLFI